MTHPILANGTALESPCGNNKRRRSTARRVSFAEVPQIRHFQQDEDEWGEPARQPQAPPPQTFPQQPPQGWQEGNLPPAKSARTEDTVAGPQSHGCSERPRQVPPSVPASASSQVPMYHAGAPAVSAPVAASISMPARPFACDRISEDSGRSGGVHGPTDAMETEATASMMAMSPTVTTGTVDSINFMGRAQSQPVAGPNRTSAMSAHADMGGDGGITASIPRLTDLVADDWTQEVPARRMSLLSGQAVGWAMQGPRDVAGRREYAQDGITASIPRLADLVADDWTQEVPVMPMPVPVPHARRASLPPMAAMHEQQQQMVADAGSRSSMQEEGSFHWPTSGATHVVVDGSSKGDISTKGDHQRGTQAPTEGRRRVSLGGGGGSLPSVMISAVRRPGHQPTRRPLGEVKLAPAQAPLAAPEKPLVPQEPASVPVTVMGWLPPQGEAAAEGITASIPRLTDLVADDWTQEVPAAAQRGALTLSLAPHAGIGGGAGGPRCVCKNQRASRPASRG
eukprot:jgi/Mesvir1/29221/Mv20415-RA.1